MLFALKLTDYAIENTLYCGLKVYMCIYMFKHLKMKVSFCKILPSYSPKLFPAPLTL